MLEAHREPSAFIGGVTSVWITKGRGAPVAKGHMNQQLWPICKALSLGIVGIALSNQQVKASELPPCPPPAANEYLLLVRGSSEPDRTRVQELLPSNTTVLVCDYLDDAVVRAGGFTSLETANAWAQYMTEVEGLQAFVARPAVPAPQANGPTPSSGVRSPAPPVPVAEPQAPAAPAAVPSSGQFTPYPLGAGYAVLVDHQNQPEVAFAIQQQVGQAVGLAVYRQRTYVLIAHSQEGQGAISTLEVLKNRDIPGFIVDSREVVMLTPAIATRSEGG